MEGRRRSRYPESTLAAVPSGVAMLSTGVEPGGPVARKEPMRILLLSADAAGVRATVVACRGRVVTAIGTR